MRALVVLLIAGCTAGIPPLATGVDAERSHVALGELQAGRAQLVQRCSGCHATPMPSEHERAAWPKQLDEMSARANLDASSRRLIEEYLVAMSPR
jgi:nitrate/TMAO reductase-like tetraheme cytochrome c subunit